MSSVTPIPRRTGVRWGGLLAHLRPRAACAGRSACHFVSHQDFLCLCARGNEGAMRAGHGPDRADGVTAVGTGDSPDAGRGDHAPHKQITGLWTGESLAERLDQIPLEIRSPRRDRAFALGDRVLTALVIKSGCAPCPPRPPLLVTVTNGPPHARPTNHPRRYSKELRT